MASQHGRPSTKGDVLSKPCTYCSMPREWPKAGGKSVRKREDCLLTLSEHPLARLCNRCCGFRRKRRRNPCFLVENFVLSIRCASRTEPRWRVAGAADAFTRVYISRDCRHRGPTKPHAASHGIAPGGRLPAVAVAFLAGQAQQFYPWQRNQYGHCQLRLLILLFCDTTLSGAHVCIE